MVKNESNNKKVESNKVRKLDKLDGGGLFDSNKYLIVFNPYYALKMSDSPIILRIKDYYQEAVFLNKNDSKEIVLDNDDIQ